MACGVQQLTLGNCDWQRMGAVGRVRGCGHLGFRTVSDRGECSGPEEDGQADRLMERKLELAEPLTRDSCLGAVSIHTAQDWTDWRSRTATCSVRVLNIV